MFVLISASRRTDIPAWYPEWFMNRVRAGFVLVANPYNPSLVHRIILKPDLVDCFVFFTKNPLPLMPYLSELDAMGYKYAFQMSLTGCKSRIEENLPDKKLLLKTLASLGEQFGASRVVWRYDPIVIEPDMDKNYYLRAFEKACSVLSGKINRVVFSFVDKYKHLEPFWEELSHNDMCHIAGSMADIANKYKMSLATCCEAIDLSEYNIKHASCISREDMENLLGDRLICGQDKYQRTGCRCLESYDIGAYNSCVTNCLYCYATRSYIDAKLAFKRHDPLSPLLNGVISDNCNIIDRPMYSLCSGQASLI